MIADWLARKEVCICCGSGGGGKTTTSAAIALGMAARGKKVAVLTIDPAKRLANSLGLPELGNEERLVKADVEGAEVDVLRGASRLLASPNVSWLLETHSLEHEQACLTCERLRDFHALLSSD